MLGYLLPDGALRLACVGAHCDDLEIGAGGTIMRLLDEHPGSTVDWVILTGDPQRRGEAVQACSEFCAAAASVRTHLWDLPDALLPWHGPEVKSALAGVARSGPHDLVLAPALHDRHQDHRLVAEAAHQTWRDHPIWSYEIVKWEGDLRTPNLYMRLGEDVVARKLDLLSRHFPSQHGHSWYDNEAFGALLRIRGVECNARHAEGFHVPKSAI